MAQATKTSTITLELTEEEADFISAITQNSLAPNEEDKEARLRRGIFAALAGLSNTYSFEESP